MKFVFALCLSLTAYAASVTSTTQIESLSPETCAKYKDACDDRFKATLSHATGVAVSSVPGVRSKRALSGLPPMKDAASFRQAVESYKASPKTIQVGVYNFPPFLKLNETKDGEVQVTGYCAEMWEQMAKTNNITFQYFRTTRSKATKLLQSGKMDIVIGPMSVQYDRSNVMYTLPVWYGGTSVMTKIDKDAGMSMTATMTLVRGVGGIAGVLLVAGFLFWATHYRLTDEKEGRNGVFYGTMWGIYLGATTMTTVGWGDEVPKGVMGKSWGLVWLFMGLFMTSALTATISADLALDAINPGISGMQDIPGTQFQVGAIKDSFAFRWAFSQVLQKEVKAYKGIKELSEAVLSGDIDAALSSTATLAYAASHMSSEQNDDGTLMVVGSPAHVHGLSFAYNKNTFDANTVQLIDSSLVEPDMVGKMADKYFNQHEEESILTESE